MRSRGAFLTLVLVLAAVIAGGWWLEQRAGLKPARAMDGSSSVAGPDDAPSGAWYCPHGGGKGWTGAVSITNPGATDVTVRIRSMTRHGSHPGQTMTVPARSRVKVEVPAITRDAATEVEYFGGWVGVGWTTKARGAPTSLPGPSPSPGGSQPTPGTGGGDGTPTGIPLEEGVAAESCAGATSRTWYMVDGSTVQGQQMYVVVMNPFASEASFRLELFAEARSRDAGEFTVPAGSSRAVYVDDLLLGDQTVAARVTSTIGRVAASTLDISDAGGVRSAIGVVSPVADPVVPGAGDAGGTEFPFLNPGQKGITYGVDFLSEDGRHLALPPGQTVGPELTRTEALTATGPGAVSMVEAHGEPVFAARRTLGIRGDQGSTPALEPAPAWLLSSPAWSGKDSVAIALANTGDAPVTVRLTALTTDGPIPGDPAEVTIPPDSAVAAPTDFLGGNAGASVLAVSDGGAFTAVMTAASKSGPAYAAAAGVPIPPQWVPEP